MKFKDLNIKEDLKKSLEEMGFETLSKIQEETISFHLENPEKDIIAQAETGTGKTAAFSIPFLNEIIEEKHTQVLIVSPTRELSTQIYKQVELMSKHLNLNSVLILGGNSYKRQFKELSKKPQIIIGTPGRLNDLLNANRFNLKNIKYFILDEADELLKIGFKKEIENIISYLPKKRINFFFTATFDKKTKELSEKITTNPYSISVSSGLNTTKKVNQHFMVVREKNKLNNLILFLTFYNPNSMIIFGRTKNRVDELNNALIESGFNSYAIQGNMQQSDRNAVMNRFRNKKSGILIATDVVARGIDIDHVDWVINFDLPQEIEYYTHRIGRVGRAGRTGHSLSFVKEDEIEHLNEIKIKTQSKIEKMDLPTSAEINKKWISRLIKNNEEILENYSSSENSFLEEEISKYSKEELVILFSDFLLKNKKTHSKIKLRPEPSVVLKGAAKNRSIRNRVSGKNFSNSRKRNSNRKNFSSRKQHTRLRVKQNHQKTRP